MPISHDAPDKRPLGFTFMTIGAFLTTFSAYLADQTRFALFTGLFAFVVGGIGVMSHLRDTGKPCSGHLLRGFGTGICVAALFAFLTRDWSDWPFAYGMWTQVIIMALSLYGDAVEYPT